MGQIYKITNKTNGKSYVGATAEDFSGRYRGGRWWATTHNHELQDDAFRFGESSFTVEILYDNVAVDDLAEVEYDMINVHQTMSPEGYNLVRTKQKFSSKEDPAVKSARLEKLRRQLLRQHYYEEMNKVPFTVAAAVKGLRAILGQSQHEFAKFQGVSFRTLREVESGEGNPTVETIDKLLRGSGAVVSISLQRKTNGV